MAAILDSIILPSELNWVDEHDWQPVQQNFTRSLGGRLFVQKRTVIKGRPITLASFTDPEWIDRAKLDKLISLAEKGQVMTLVLNAFSYQVMFDYSASPIEASPIEDFVAQSPDNFYTIVIKLVTV